jgi:cytochrome c2
LFNLDRAILLQSGIPALPEHRIANIFKPLATPAQSEYRIALFVFAITAAIFVVVAGLLIYTIVRFRRKPGDDSRQEPPQVCGTQHANMLLRVIVHPEGEFEQWAAAQRKPAQDNVQVAAGKTVFMACMSCHAVQGTRAKGTAGPDLTHLMSRQTIGSGVVTNTPENLRAWVKDPQAVKPGCLMPSMKISDKQLDSVVSYLQSLN